MLLVWDLLQPHMLYLLGAYSDLLDLIGPYLERTGICIYLEFLWGSFGTCWDVFGIYSEHVGIYFGIVWN